VKRLSADGSVGSPHVRVGHRQALNPETLVIIGQGFFMSGVCGAGLIASGRRLMERGLAHRYCPAPF
jgi:hypothetical protein